MENFVLYHVILKQDGITMYKGRKKNTISYVAVSCIDKKRRVKVTNHVRLFYELDNPHVARFLEWYETSNHLWLVTELCVGGSLSRMLEEDGEWPENCIRKFSVQLIRGLSYLHECGILFILWHPSKIVLDGQGMLKFFDFSESRKRDEDIDELVNNFFSGLNISGKEVTDLFDYSETTSYMAPELITSNTASDAISYNVDIWGLGCIMYEMLTGQSPFAGVNSKELQRNILHTPLIIPKTVGRNQKVSAELMDLLDQMLNKNYETRITLHDVCNHPFWQGHLDDLLLVTGNQLTNTRVAKTLVGENNSVGSSSGGGTNTVDDLSFTLHIVSNNGPKNAVNSGNKTSDDASNKPSHLDVELSGKMLNITGKSGDGDNKNSNNNRISSDDLINYAQLIDLVIGCNVNSTSNTKRPLDDYPKMLKDGRLKYETKMLIVPPLSTSKLRGLRVTERDRHLRQLESALRNVERGPPSQKRLNLINYTSCVALATSECSDFLMFDPQSAGLLLNLIKQAKSSPNQELAQRTCQLIAITTYYSQLSKCNDSNLINVFSDLLGVVVELLRDNFRCNKLKLASTIAIGELLIKMSNLTVSSDNTDESPVGLGLAYTMLNRCLQRNEEVVVNLVVSRTIESIMTHNLSRNEAQYSCPVVQSTCSVETFQQLYNCYKHSTTDALRCSTANAMSLLTKYESSLLDKVGSTVQQGLLLLEGIAVANNTAPLPVQQALLDMLCLALYNASVANTNGNSTLTANSCGALIRKLTSSNTSNQQKSILLSALSNLLDSSQSSAIRCKTLLALLLLPIATVTNKNSVDVALLRDIFVDIRILSHLHRKEVANPNDNIALQMTTNSWLIFLSRIALPAIVNNALAALEPIFNRRHPSTVQLKALQISLPPLEIAVVLISNASVKERLELTSLIGKLCRLLQLVEYVDGVGPSVLGGPETAPNLMIHVLSLVDGLVNIATPELFNELLLPLASLTTVSVNPDIRVIGLKLCGDVINKLLNLQEDNDQPCPKFVETLSRAIEDYLLVQADQFLQDRDPSPAHFLRILHRYLDLQPTNGLKSIVEQGILGSHVMQLLLDHQQQHRIMAGAVLESLGLICAISQINTEPLHQQMLESDFMLILRDVTLDIGSVYYRDVGVAVQPTNSKAADLMHIALETMSIMAKLISDIVRKALQCRKNAGSTTPDNENITIITAQAEELLGAGRPLTEIVGLLCQNIDCSDGNNSDCDIVDLSVKLLNQIVSLYGGQQIQHGLVSQNISCLCSAVVNGDSKHRRTLLRIIKRLLASGGDTTAETEMILKNMISHSKNQQDKDGICLNLIEEIVKLCVK